MKKVDLPDFIKKKDKVSEQEVGFFITVMFLACLIAGSIYKFVVEYLISINLFLPVIIILLIILFIFWRKNV